VYGSVLIQTRIRNSFTNQSVNRVFPIAGPKSWNSRPEDVTSSRSEYTFSPPAQNVAIQEVFYLHRHLILTASWLFSLGLSFIPFKVYDIIYNMIWYELDFVEDRHSAPKKYEYTSAVRIVVFHFESNRIESNSELIIWNLESNRIVFADSSCRKQQL